MVTSSSEVNVRHSRDVAAFVDDVDTTSAENTTAVDILKHHDEEMMNASNDDGAANSSSSPSSSVHHHQDSNINHDVSHNSSQIGLSLSPSSSPYNTLTPLEAANLLLARNPSNPGSSTTNAIGSNIHRAAADSESCTRNGARDGNDDNPSTQGAVGVAFTSSDPSAALLPRRKHFDQFLSGDADVADSISNEEDVQLAPAVSSEEHEQINSEDIDNDKSMQQIPQQNVQLEERIHQLEQSLQALTSICQSLISQQQQQQQQYSGHSTPAHSAPSTPSPPSYSAHHQLQLRHRLADSETELLSQWPPSHQVVLDSPEVSQRSRRYSYKYHHASSNSIGNNSNGGQQHRSKPSKSMSMVLLDIAPGESRGPSMIPFAEDLDAYDEMDGDSVAGGCGDGRNNNEGGESGKEVNSSSSSNSSRSEEGGTPLDGGERESQSRKNKVAATPTLSPHGQSSHEPSPSSERSNESSTARGQGRRLSSSLKQDTKSARESNLECQAYTATHLEALRLRHEAGKGRAYSFNDSLLQGGARSPESSYRNHIEKTTASASKSGERKEKLPTISSPKQWKPTFDVLNAEHKSTMSTDTFVEVVSPLIVKKDNSDLMVPILTPSKEASTDEAAADVRRKDSVSCNASSKSKKSATEMTKSASAPAATTVPVAPSTSLTSVATIETAKTIKSGTSNHSSSSKLRAGSVSSYGRDRSLSIMSEKDGTTGASNTTGNSNNNATSKNTKPCQQQQSDVKSKQTMKEYVINDLLNIDSRHQDGSATEDIDANMEEFLRIPSKLENLMVFSLAVCVDSFLYVWTMLPLKVIWAMVCLVCTILRPGKGIGGLMFHRRHLYAVLQIMLVWFVYEQVLCPISIGKLYHWIRGQAMLKLYVLIAIVEVFDRLLCSFGQDAWDSLYWNTTRRPRHPRMLVSMIVVGVYVTVHSLFLFVHVATLSVAVNSADNALLTLLISGNFAEIKSTVFKKYNKQNLFKITTSDICERFKLALFLLLILLLNCFQGEMSKSMVFDYYSMCGIVLVAELISDWIKHSFITKFNFIKSTAYFDYALILSGDVTGIGHEGLNLDYTHAAVKRIGLAQIPLVCVTARYLHEAVRFAIAFRGNGDVDHPMSALADLITDGNKWKFYSGMFGGMVALVSFKIGLGVCIRFIARRNLGGDVSVLKRKSSTPKATTNKEGGASRADKEAKKNQ
eukprot:g14601.t1 g14601   contig9:2244066-2247884(+)